MTNDRFELTVARRPSDFDRWGLVSPTALLQLAEGARWEAILHGAFHLDKLFEGGRGIVVRSQRLEINELPRSQHNLSYRDELSLGYWLEAVGRTSVLVGQDIRSQDGTTLAELRVVGVCIDAERRPTIAPEEIRQRARSEESPGIEPIYAESEGKDIFEMRIRVRQADIDLLQHVNHATYLDYCVDAQAEAAARCRLGMSEKPIGWPISSVRLDYLKEALPRDEFLIRMWVLFHSETSIDFAHEFLRNGETIHKARVVRSKVG